MKIDLVPVEDGVNLLTLYGITLLSLDNVDAWLYAIDMLPIERKEACRQIIDDGHYSVCNIEHRVEIECLK